MSNNTSGSPVTHNYYGSVFIFQGVGPEDTAKWEALLRAIRGSQPASTALLEAEKADAATPASEPNDGFFDYTQADAEFGDTIVTREWLVNFALGHGFSIIVAGKLFTLLGRSDFQKVLREHEVTLNKVETDSIEGYGYRWRDLCRVLACKEALREQVKPFGPVSVRLLAALAI